MANITTTTAATLIPEVWTSDILDIVKANLVIEPRVHHYSSLAYGKGKGDIIHVPSIIEGDADAKAAGSDVTFDATTELTIDITLDQHWYDAYQVEDIAKVQAYPDLMNIYTSKAGYSVSKKKDGTLAALATGFSQTTGTAGTDVTDAVVLRSVQYLDDANSPMNDRHFVIKPAVKADILALDKFVLFQNTGSSPDGGRVMTGRLGQIYGVDVAVTTQITTTAGSPDTINNMMFHRDALGVASSIPMRVQSQYRIESLANAIVADSVWGVKEMRDTFGVWVKA